MDILKPLVESGFPNILKQLKGIGTNITVKVLKFPEIHMKGEMWTVDLIWNLPLMKALNERTLLMSTVPLKTSKLMTKLIVHNEETIKQQRLH